MTTQTAAPQQRLSAPQQDQIATRLILQQAIDKSQSVASTTVFPASNPVLIINPQNVGLIKRFLIKVQGVLTNSGSTTVNLTQFGLANIFSQNGGLQYLDLNNYLRINTNGIHLTMLANAKRRGPFGGSYQTNTANGSNLSEMLNVPPATWPVFQAPQTIASGATANFTAYFEMPLAYTNDDLRGAVYANVLNAVQQLTLTFNQQVVSAGTNDDTFAIYSGAAGSAGSITSATVTVYQYYLDQLPMTKTGVLLPQLSLSTVYELKSVLNSSIPQNQEFYMPYANQRSFASTFGIFNSTGQAGGRNTGSDINYLALQATNSQYFWKLDPTTVALQGRDELTTDLPAGTYYFPSRRRNIATLQYGNVQLTLNNAAATNAAAYFLAMYESFALLNTLQSGPSLSQS